MHEAASSPGWTALFGGNSEHGKPESVRFLRRGGRPFLFLPGHPRAAIAVLELYPAQRRAARIAKALVATGLTLKLPLPLPSLSVRIDPSAPFVRFMAGQAGQNPGSVPIWGMLAGNPNAPGQRLVFLTFNRTLEPHAVIKVGQGDLARHLITKEVGALAALPTGLAGVPRLLGQWGDASAAALALPYVSGSAPSADQIDPAATILTDWIRFGNETPLDSLAGWRAVLETGCGLPMLPKSPLVRAPITHGDFAPWNIKVSKNGDWTVLDWERGELCGVPAWDWFHFVLQPAVLVEKLQAEALAQRAEQVLASAAFQHYAETAKIRGLERALLLGYLTHCSEVIRQTEGAPALSGARAILLEQWR